MRNIEFGKLYKINVFATGTSNYRPCLPGRARLELR